MTRALLEARGPRGARAAARRILHGVSVALRAGEAVALVGPNAAGKSTLRPRRSPACCRPTSGAVRLDGRPLADWRRDALARAVALVTPEERRPSLLTVQERVALGRYPHRGPFRPLTAADRDGGRRALEPHRDRAPRAPAAGHALGRRAAARRAGARPGPAAARAAARRAGRPPRRRPPAAALPHPRRDPRRRRRRARRRPRPPARGGLGGADAAARRRAGPAEGAPAAVLGSEACARAFEVAIRGPRRARSRRIRSTASRSAR